MDALDISQGDGPPGQATEAETEPVTCLNYETGSNGFRSQIIYCVWDWQEAAGGAMDVTFSFNNTETAGGGFVPELDLTVFVGDESKQREFQVNVGNFRLETFSFSSVDEVTAILQDRNRPDEGPFTHIVSPPFSGNGGTNGGTDGGGVRDHLRGDMLFPALLGIASAGAAAWIRSQE